MSSASAETSKREHFRHTLATLAYRGGKVVRNAPPEFATFKISASTTTRTPVEILAHIGDLLDWGLSISKGQQAWHTAAPGTWESEARRFFAALEQWDRYLASEARLGASTEQLFQGPIADALTHVGQLALLRRLAGSPVRAENYFKADIAAGRVGAEQSPPKQEFG